MDTWLNLISSRSPRSQRLSPSGGTAAEAQRVQARGRTRRRSPATAEEAANFERHTRWLYRRRLPFVKRLSRKCVRFSETGLRKWAASNRP
jgi:hypothetical protein